MPHTFHIPVLGLGYSIDTPLKVARFGISSVVSIVDDELTERMRKHHSEINHEPYQLITKSDPNSRSERITAYLNLLTKLVNKQASEMTQMSFEEDNDLCRYFELLPEGSQLSAKYHHMQLLPIGTEKHFLQWELKRDIATGNIDVNIMSKVDKANYLKDVYLGDEHTDALAAIRGFANSELNSSVVISAGLNPRLFSYMEEFSDFYPKEDGSFNKQIILKVSDYRSALIQAKVLAKKGLWVSEFRIESGLNCGGHAFATEGLLLGPILQEFKDNRMLLHGELLELYINALLRKEIKLLQSFNPVQKITVQGGIGTAEEHQFLISYYQLDAAGWGSPFLLVPEATNVDADTLVQLADAEECDFYLSDASPLGIPFNNFAKSTGEQQRIERIERGRPGSPCTKKFLVSNTEFTAEPICTASREYQNLKIKQLQSMGFEQAKLTEQISKVTEKICLCEGLCASAYLADDLLRPRENKAVSICPGPNLAYFNKKYSLKEMIDHIYGKNDLLAGIARPNLFIKEFGLYIDYLKKEIENILDDVNLQWEDWNEKLQEVNGKKSKYFSKFYDQLNNGINYYRELINSTDLSKHMWDTEQLRQFNLISERLKALMS
ncbi:hypothetical protein [Pedobacter psychroterrae]|uniref:Uncharacterized protein n=1 Tax=Pedobacter psychroterrae TaxID=2530453 RepID=A0A4R0NMF6_9SPHI|nr:hypothetical protein [Pedobacter psychroterrae]TCD01108.1 hypothetical protein EZ437_10080 [Pedobacter psychroterrae]